MNYKETAREIAFDLMDKYDENDPILIDNICKECYKALEELKADIEDEVIKTLERHNYKISY